MYLVINRQTNQRRLARRRHISQAMQALDTPGMMPRFTIIPLAWLLRSPRRWRHLLKPGDCVT